MKDILFGIYDYISDSLHDWHLHWLTEYYKSSIWYSKDQDTVVLALSYKEGSVWYYIKQRKLAHKKGKKK